MSEGFYFIHKPENQEKPPKNADQASNKTPKRRKSLRGEQTKENASVKSVRTPGGVNKGENGYVSNALQNAFKKFEEKINENKKEIHQNLYQTICENTIEYFNYYINKRLSNSSGSKAHQLNPICYVIPTIALHTGINSHDYNHLSESLSNYLRINFTKHLFIINEKNASNLKSIVNAICFQWDDKIKHNNKEIKSSTFTFKNLFETIVTDNEEQNIKSHSVVFVFKQFELIPKETLESFASLISCHVEKISIFFIFELASQSNIIYEQLSSNIISKLCIKKMYAMPPEQYIDKFLNKLFVEQLTLFKVSDEILKYLIDIYYEYNLSMNNLIYALKFCFYDHIHSNPINLLFLEESGLTDIHYYDIFSNDETIQDKIIEYVKNDCEELYGASDYINKIRDEWFEYNNEFVFICKILFKILRHFPSEEDESSLFSKNHSNFIEFYCKITHFSSSLSINFIETEQYSNLKRLLMLSSNNTIDEIISSIVQLVHTMLHGEFKNNYNSIFLSEMNNFMEFLYEFQKIRAMPSINSKANDLVLEPVTNKKKIDRRSSIKTVKTFSETNNQQGKDGLDSNKLKSVMVDWLSTKFSKYFTSDYLSKIPYSKHFCYSNIDKLKQRLFAIQRLNKHQCLIDPFKYLKLEEYSKKDNESPRKKLKKKSIGGNQLTNDQLPLNVIYRLYLEFGHMINLYDWLLAFVEKLENSDIDDLQKEKKQIIQALFFRSITELQFMGYIKPTSRKVDHVVKLTNGANILAIE